MDNRIPVLYFHSVAPFKDRKWKKSFLSLELTFFISFVKTLRKMGFRFVNLNEYYDIRSGNKKYKDKLVCLTFDDGYLDNYVYVLPVLDFYKAKGTIFVNPSLVQHERVSRELSTFTDSEDDDPTRYEFLGFCNWAELREMDRSGIIDVQSHTMRHTKLFCSDALIDFHHPGAKWLYPISNQFPEEAPYYATNPEFELLIPYGTPFFEEESSMIAKEVKINESFTQEVVNSLKATNSADYSFESCMKKVQPIYDDYVLKDKLIEHKETEAEYQQRVCSEITDSKLIIEKQLRKTVNHICWPHGDYNEYCHNTAMEAGFKSSLFVGRDGSHNTRLDKFERMGAGNYKNSILLSNAKMLCKIQAHREVFPFKQTQYLYRFLRYGIR